MNFEFAEILNPSRNEFKRLIEIHEEEWGYLTTCVYNKTLADINNLDLCEINLNHIKGPIRTYLFNWGSMGRVLNRKEFNNWMKDLLKKIKDNCRLLGKFRKLKLEEYELEATKYKDIVIKIYNDMEKIIKPTATGKVLHILIPNFFPLWDSRIRGRVYKDMGKVMNENGMRINNSYYKFIMGIKYLLKKYKNDLIELSDYFHRPELKLIDEYLWEKTK